MFHRIAVVVFVSLASAAFASVASGAEPVGPTATKADKPREPTPPQQTDAKPASVYLIGNSLTWDTVPSKLEGDVQWHVDCGKSLAFIHANPAEPCVKTSTLWPEALRAKQYDFICFQPHYGTEIADDVAVISDWLKLQPTAVVVIHTGWARQADRVSEWADASAEGKLTHSRVHFQALLDALRKRHPNREFRTTGAMLLLEAAASDIAADKAPFTDIAELYRDAIHMNVYTGRYLMHNAVRQTLGQPILTEWPTQSKDANQPTLTAARRDYLNGLLSRQPEMAKRLLRPESSR